MGACVASIAGVYTGRYTRWWTDGTSEGDGMMVNGKRQTGFVEYNEDGTSKVEAR
jgi:hypothetical protein